MVETLMFGQQPRLSVLRLLGIAGWLFLNTAMAFIMQCGGNMLLFNGEAMMNLLTLGVRYSLILLTHSMSLLML